MLYCSVFRNSSKSSRRRIISTLAFRRPKDFQIILSLGEPSCSRVSSYPSFCNRNRVSSTCKRFFTPNNLKNDGEQDPPTNIWKQLQSPPNILTLARMGSTPLLSYWIVSESYTYAIWGCVLAAVSDFMDGFLAKRFGWATTIGTYLDPLADKVLINTLGISLWYSCILPTPLIALWATKDVMLLSGTAWHVYQNHQSINIFCTSVARSPLKVSPSNIAKVNTAFQFATLGIGIVSPVASISPMILNSLCWVTGVTTVGSGLSYVVGSGLFVENHENHK